MRPGRFPKVNDTMLAEALRQLLPLAATGLAVTPTDALTLPLMRAQMVLDMWTRQERGRVKLLGGPLPTINYPPPSERLASDQVDPGQVIPPECERPRPPRKPRKKPEPEAPQQTAAELYEMLEFLDAELGKPTRPYRKVEVLDDDIPF